MRRTAPLILGAGPAGCAAAIVLGRAGVAATLLDRDAEPGDPLCGGFLSWRTSERLRGLGIDLPQLGAQRVTRLALLAPRREAELALPAPAFGLSRHALDSALRSRALASGARLEVDTARRIEGTRVIGRQRTWSGDGLFLATGKHDVRGGARQRTTRDPTLGLRVRLPASEARTALLAGRIELHLFDGGYCGILLQEDGSANLCLAVRKSRFAGDPTALLEHWADQSAAFANRLGDDWRSARFDSIASVPYGYVSRTTEPGVFRLGDQAAVIPSLAGEGIAIALASGTMAAEHLLRGGSDAALGFQRAFAARATVPVRTAAAAWAMAERRPLAFAGVALAGQVPGVVRWLMHATRLDLSPSLAPVPAGP